MQNDVTMAGLQSQYSNWRMSTQYRPETVQSSPVSHLSCDCRKQWWCWWLLLSRGSCSGQTVVERRSESEGVTERGCGGAILG